MALLAARPTCLPASLFLGCVFLQPACLPRRFRVVPAPVTAAPAVATCHRNPQRCLDTGARARARDPPTRSSSTTAAAGEGEGGTKGVARQESPQSTESDGEVPEQAIKARLSPCHRATPACLPASLFFGCAFPQPACLPLKNRGLMSVNSLPPGKKRNPSVLRPR